MYQYLINQGTPFTNEFIGKLKIPLKIKIFTWYTQLHIILTKAIELASKSIVFVIVVKQLNTSFLPTFKSFVFVIAVKQLTI